MRILMALALMVMMGGVAQAAPERYTFDKSHTANFVFC